MKRTIRSFQDDHDEKNRSRLSKSAKPTASRMRVLVFACNPDDVQYMMNYGDRIEIAYLPSHDMQEIKAEIERFNPNMVLCSADVFLDTYPARPVGHPSLDKPDGAIADAEAISSPITWREMRVLAMLAKGQTNDEIAKALRVSSRTVKRILSGLYERLHVTNRTELVGRAAELSLKEVN